MDLDAGWLDRLQKARDKLAAQLHNHPGVSMIDAGFDPQQDMDQADRQVVLRVHLSGAASAADLNLPDEVDGIPVRVIRVNYRLE